MSKTASAASTRHMTSTRTGASKNLLARKAREQAAAAVEGNETLEALFPSADADANQQLQAVVSSVEYIEPAVADGAAAVAPSLTLPSSSEASASAGPAQSLALAPAWSEEDERALQGMLARRKAAGYQRRGRDVGGQRLQVGQVTPNANTVSATIVALVAARLGMTRAELLDMMATARFPHAKAKPSDRSWCQGWVAGALRGNFLTLCHAGDAEEPAQ